MQSCIPSVLFSRWDHSAGDWYITWSPPTLALLKAWCYLKILVVRKRSASVQYLNLCLLNVKYPFTFSCYSLETMYAPNSWAQARTSIPCFDDWLDFYGPFIKTKRETRPLEKKCRHCFAKGLNKNGRHCHFLPVAARTNYTLVQLF